MQKSIVLFLIILTTSIAQAHQEPWDANKTDWSPLMLAVYNGETGKMMILIGQGTDINYTTSGKQNHWQLTVMDVAIRKENETAVEKLLSTNRVSKPGSYLMTASGQKSAAIVEMLLKHGANPNDTLENGYSVLMNAASFGSDAVLESLLKHKASTHQIRKIDGMTALMLAAFNGETEKVRLLLNHGADKSIKDYQGRDALYYAEHIYEYKDINERTLEHLRTMLR